MAATGHSCFRLVYFKKSSSLKLLCQNEPKFIDETYHVSVHLAKLFQSRRFLEIGQSETRIASGGHVC
jgi:hypothetical protein